MTKIRELLLGKKPWLLFILGMAGILFIFLSSLVPSDGTEEEVPETDPALQIEARLTETIEKIAGAGETHVMVTLADSGRTEYLVQENGSEEYEEGTLLRRENDCAYVTAGGGAVIVSQQFPRVAGVAVVCKGGDQPNVQSDIYEVIYALYGLSTARVSIERLQ